MSALPDAPVRALVVEDEPAVRAIILRVLRGAGYVAEGVDCASAARECLAAGGIDVLLCDLRLGDGDGLEVLREATTCDPPPAAVAVTGLADRDVVARALAAGATAYVTKPFKVSDIEIAVQQALLGRASARQLVQRERRLERELRHRTDIDALTGLLNRRRFGAELERHLHSCRRDGRRGALLACDLDDFRLINDSHGHAAGDGVLRRAAQIIQSHLRATDFAARIDGDEFAVLLSDVDRAGALQVAGALQLLLAAPDAIGSCAASIGVATFDGRDGPVAEELLVAADAALDDAKQGGRNRIATYAGPNASSLSWVERIRAALRDDRLVIHTQPIVDLHTGGLSHEELLVRMLDPSGELVAPVDFLPTAERFGLIELIDTHVLQRALGLMAAGRAVNINIATATMQNGSHVDTISAHARAGVDPRLLTIEITETMAASNMDLVRDFAERVAALGCGLALDDFGTGFGTLTYLKHLPITAIKIDRDFVGDLASDHGDQRMVQAIVEIARASGQTTVAEGVEDAPALELLRRFGVDCAQGYYLAPPAPVASEAPGLLHRLAPLRD